MILIIGQSPDLHIEKVAGMLKNKGMPVAIFQRYNNKDTLTFSLCNSKREEIRLKTRENIDLKQIRSVWLRTKPHLTSEYPGGIGSLEERFIVNEWSHILRPLLSSLKHVSWINYPENHYHFLLKINQLKLAKSCNLFIPDTIISNSVDDVLQLFNKHKKIIYKTLSSFIIPPDKVIYSTLLSRKEIEQSRDSFIIAPGIYQSYIEKSYELRVIIIGQKVFIAHIDSQSSDETKIDWRKNQLRQMYKPGKLTDKTLKKLKEFHKKAGLVYASYDFVVDQLGNEIFLECNPGGQWLWIEDALNFNISETLAEELAKNVS